MPKACTVSHSMSGNVKHHAGHIIGYREECTGSGEDEVCVQVPIYCTGHSVSGKQTKGQSKVMIQGKPAAVVGDSGSSTCPCDGKGYTNVQGSSKVFINGKPAVRLGDKVNIHGQGSGNMTSGSSKVYFG